MLAASRNQANLGRSLGDLRLDFVYRSLRIHASQQTAIAAI